MYIYIFDVMLLSFYKFFRIDSSASWEDPVTFIFRWEGRKHSCGFLSFSFLVERRFSLFRWASLPVNLNF